MTSAAPGYKIVKVDNEDNADMIVADMIISLIKSKPNCTIGFATGSTPIHVYEHLVHAKLDWSGVKTFNLDEYVGLEGTHPQSYRYFMEEHLFKHVNLKKENIHFLDGKASDLEAECKRYEECIAKNPIDMQLLGVGTNGHIAFNEPGTPFEAQTHVVKLAEQTIKDNSRFFKPEEQQPTQALTMGIATILKSKEIILLAKGEKKANVVEKAFKSKPDPEIPASALQSHKRSFIIISIE